MIEQGTGMTGTTRTTIGLLRGRRWILLPVAALLMAVVGGLIVTREQAPDPSWNGHRLSHYVDLLPATYTTGDDGYTIYPIHTHKWRNLSQPQQAAKWNEHEQRANAAREAIVKIGADGLTWLMQELLAEDSAIERGLGRTPKWSQGLLLHAGYRASPTPTYHQRWQVVTALRELHRAKVDLSSAMAGLLTLATNENPDIGLAATFLIRQIDSAQLAKLRKAGDLAEPPSALTGGQGN